MGIGGLDPRAVLRSTSALLYFSEAKFTSGRKRKEEIISQSERMPVVCPQAQGLGKMLVGHEKQQEERS
jgi:hypothetical protein